jgi:hypothetical protein
MDFQHVEIVAALDLRRGLEDDEVEQDLALRRQQGAEPRRPGRDPVEVAGDEPVEKTLGVLAGNSYHAPVGQMR